MKICKRRSPLYKDHENLRAVNAVKNGIISPLNLQKYYCKIKGRGIITKTALRKGEFVVYYHGIFADDCPNGDDHYFFEVHGAGKPVFINASMDDGSFGRLLNDNSYCPNIVPKFISVNGRPHVCFFALRDVSAGEPLEYSYGGASANYPWRNGLRKRNHKCLDGCTKNFNDIKWELLSLESKNVALESEKNHCFQQIFELTKELQIKQKKLDNLQKLMLEISSPTASIIVIEESDPSSPSVDKILYPTRNW